MRQRLVLLSILSILPIQSQAIDASLVERGKYLYLAADCRGCHANGENDSPSGGRPIDTPFGTFFSTNISSDVENGIGKWTEDEFISALRNGVAPGGKQLFPVFPYTSYTGLTDEDIRAIRAYIMTLPPSTAKNKEHQIHFPFSFRPAMLIWKALFLERGPMMEDQAQAPDWNRGRYLVGAVTHCTECHSPRNKLTGVIDRRREFSGNIGGPDGMNAPNITSHNETGIGSWTIDEITRLLKTGETPDYDLVSSGMTSVVRGTKMLSDEDRHAIAVYLKTLPALRSEKMPPKVKQ